MAYKYRFVPFRFIALIDRLNSRLLANSISDSQIGLRMHKRILIDRILSISYRIL